MIQHPKKKHQNMSFKEKNPRLTPSTKVKIQKGNWLKIQRELVSNEFHYFSYILVILIGYFVNK